MIEEKLEAWLGDRNRQTLVMGVLNVTPDSFSDGGRFADPRVAVEHGLRMCNEGADVIDIGGESTRPGSQRVGSDEQIRRIGPVIEGLAGKAQAVLSVDTTRSAVARAACDMGAGLINDISGGLDDAAMLPLAAERRVPIVLMHMQGQPATMQEGPRYEDVVAEVAGHLEARRRAAREAGVEAHRILLDPGIGFGKTAEHNLALLRELRRFAALGSPLVVGTSRKGFIGRITGESEPSGRVMGTAASVAWCVANGAAMVRVHDVGHMSKVVRVVRAIQSGEMP